MKKLLSFKYIEILFYSIILFINLLFTIILYSLKLTSTDLSVWSSMGYMTYRYTDISYSRVVSTVGYLAIALFVLFMIGVFLSVASIVLHQVKKRKWGYYVAISYQIGLNVVILIMHMAVKMFSVGAIVLAILNLILLLCSFVVVRYARTKDEADSISETSKNYKLYKIVLLVLETLSLFFVFLTFFIPLFTQKLEYDSVTYILINALGQNTYPIYISIIFILMFLLFFVCLMSYVISLSSYFRTDKSFAIHSKACIYGNVVVTLIYFLMGYFVCFYNGMKKIEASTISYIPFVFAMVSLLIFSIFQGKLAPNVETNTSEQKKTFKFEPLIYVIILTVLTFLTMAFNIIEVHIKVSSFAARDIVLSGYKLLTSYANLGGGFQLLAFILFSFLLISGVLFVLSISSFFAKYKDYYKVVKVTAITNVIFMLLLGLFSIYYSIAKKINEEMIASLLEAFHISLPTDYTYTVTSQTLYIFIAGFIVLLIMIFRGQLNHHIAEEAILKLSKDSDISSKDTKGQATSGVALDLIDFDACPAFTELDSKIEQYKTELEQRHQNEFSNISLPNLVRFIVDYARESRLHLSYSLEDIATFVAGLGASRLAILQGMSGTGKTSLPKIFAEAIMGNCEIVEVESSWRDKNELLGYYNEFSKCFTPKKFTQCLYKAKLNPNVPTFIVLDEMNLSRIEYYFSDFLSLMENEEEKREIKLLNVKLTRIVDDEPHEYYGLTEGHTIKIPTNVWFIGTANKDESTFEISDKVYDRAQTMNFNKRAPKIHSFSEPLAQRFASYDQIARLFEEAKSSYSFDAEENKIINKVEKLLIPYNISFGNRILKQMEDFVKIYCACFGDKNAVLDDAVEKILLSKVVSKLEYKIVEDKESLALEFDKLGLSLCSAFVRRLNED